MNRDAILNMLHMQHRMNSRVHEDWINQGFEWYRAAWIECGELMDHVGYKWWKKQTPDMEQVRLEVVDIWHFGLSALFEPDADLEALAGQIAAEFMERPKGLASDGSPTQRIHTATEALAQHALQTKGFSVTLFASLMDACDLSADALYRHYVGKNVLNFSGRIMVIRTGLTSKSGRGERIMNTFRSCSTHWMRPRPDSPRQFMTRCQRVTPQ